MHHHRCVDSFERARARHQLLTSSAFFGRRAEKAHAARQPIPQLGEGQGCT
jgi:hypothetical protein